MIHKNKSDTAKQLLALFSRGGDTNSRRVSDKRIPSSFKERWGKPHQKQEKQNLFWNGTRLPTNLHGCVVGNARPLPAPGGECNYHENGNKTRE